jgi:Fe-S cluster biogenesis protein NfuA
MTQHGFTDLNAARVRIGEVLDSLRQYLQADGGDIELVDVHENGDFYVRFLGECAACPLNIMTLQAGIMHVVNQRVPGSRRAEMVRGTPEGENHA